MPQTSDRSSRLGAMSARFEDVEPAAAPEAGPDMAGGGIDAIAQAVMELAQMGDQLPPELKEAFAQALLPLASFVEQAKGGTQAPPAPPPGAPPIGAAEPVPAGLAPQPPAM